MKIAIILFILGFSWLPGITQSLKKAEKSALKCLDEKLTIVDKDINYLLTSSMEYSSLISKMNTESFDRKKKEIDSILNECGFYKAGSLDISMLKNCMLSSYDFDNTKIDTTSSYYQLLNHLTYLSENPFILKELSPSLHLETIKSLITIDNQDKDFYKVITFILFQGIIREIENYSNRFNDSNKISLIDSELDKKQDIQIITSLEEFIANEKELTLDRLIIEDSSCNEEVYFIVEKMPEFNGGKQVLENFLVVNSTETKGRVFIQFIIDCKGSVRNPKVAKGLTPLTDKIAIDLVKSMPDWTPGEQKGKKVNIQQTCPVIFN